MSIGIDRQIDDLLSVFNSHLWAGKDNAFYGRVFRNERGEDNLISPEVWLSPDHYIEVLKDYSKDGQCFFDVQPTIPIEAFISDAVVWICFMVNLAEVYPTLTRTEATEQAHRDTIRLIDSSPFEVTELITGITGFSDYDWKDSPQAKADMSPHYLFRFTTSINYVNC